MEMSEGVMAMLVKLVGLTVKFKERIWPFLVFIADNTPGCNAVIKQVFDTSSST
jgi:branched-subunit amino acid transport protein AzlD